MGFHPIKMASNPHHSEKEKKRKEKKIGSQKLSLGSLQRKENNALTNDLIFILINVSWQAIWDTMVGHNPNTKCNC
jgi:hypothetical protein